MTKILMCSHQFSGGGISHVANCLKESLMNLGCSVDVMAPSYSTRKVDVPVPCLKPPGFLSPLLFWNSVARKAAKIKEQYDLLIMHHPVSHNGAFLNLGKITVNVFHGTYYGYAQAYRLFKLGKYSIYYDTAARIEKNLLNILSNKQSPEIIVTGVSPSTISELRANGYRGTAHHIPNAIPLISEIPSKKEARKTISDSLNIPVDSDDVMLLYVGSSRNMPGKREVLVPALFRKMKKLSRDLKLVLVGGGPLFDPIKKMAKKSPYIYYTGFVPHGELGSLYSSADAYISLSCYEGLPNSMLEAAAFKLPLILTDIPPHRYILSCGLGRGILINVFDPVEDAPKVQAFLESLNESKSLYAYSDIHTKFTWDRIAERYLKIAEI